MKLATVISVLFVLASAFAAANEVGRPSSPATTPENDPESPPMVFSPAPTALEPARITKSPVVLKRLYGSRSVSSNTAAFFDTDTVVMRSLRWLKAIQHDDGSWGEDAEPADVATALALLTFLGRGETPSSEEFGATVGKGFGLLVAEMKPPGRPQPGDRPVALGHGISTWALCEGYAMTKHPMLMVPAEEALATILKKQRASGLWDLQYLTDGGQDSVEATLWQTTAIRSGLLMGSKVDGLRDGLRRASDGLEKRLATDTNILTVAGAAFCLQMAGRGNSPSCRSAVERLGTFKPNWDSPPSSAPILVWYLMAKARFGHGGQMWNDWNRTFNPVLVSSQVVLAGKDGKEQGYWASPGCGDRYGRIYATALASMMLQVYYAHQPTFRPLPPDPEETKPPAEEIRLQF